MILPIYAGLERLPDSLFEASADLGARAGRTFRRVVLPMVFPAIVAGSIFTFSLSMGDYIAVQHRRRHRASCSATSSTTTSVAANNLPFAAAVATIPSSSCWPTSRRSAAPERWRTL